MLARLQPIVPVLLGVVFAQLALGSLNPLTSLSLAQRGVPTAVIGLVASAYFVGFLLGAWSCARVVDRVGHIRAFAVFAALPADSVLLQAVTEEPAMWALFRGTTGWSMAGVFLVAESWLNDKTTAEARGRTFATYQVVSWGGSAMGPLTLNLASASSYELFVGIAMGFATALVPMALTQVGNPDIGQRARLGVRRLFEISPLGVVACFGAGLVNSAFYQLMPVFAQGQGLSQAQLSLLLTTALIGGLMAQYPVGWLSDHFGRRPVALATMLMALAAMVAALVAGPDPFSLLLALLFLFAGMMAPLYGLGVGQTNDYVQRKDFVAASGGLLFTWAAGASAGPALASLVMSFAGPRGLFIYVAAVLGSVAGFTVFRMRRRGGVPLERQSSFVPTGQQPPPLSEIDPRAAESFSRERTDVSSSLVREEAAPREATGR